jgi:CHAT domain-containing protein
LSKSQDPASILIPDFDQIQNALSCFRRAISSGDGAALKEQIQILSDKLWKPIAAALPTDTKRIYIGADGPLNFLSFATLLDDQGKFLSEKYQIAYVGSGRDLLRPAKPIDKKNMVIYANPVFASDEGSKITTTDSNCFTNRGMRPAELSEFAKVQLPQLPGTQEEATIVSGIAKDAHWTDETHLGNDASKNGLMSIKAPAVLHLATHGFFLGGEDVGGEGERGMKIAAAPDVPITTTSNNPKPLKISPMRQSGIALTGGQSTIQAWGRGEFPDPSNDGILTAEEVAGLDLDGTWLVTLSACETGVGQVQSGEGVFGLRRAFMMAGAQNLLMTLWPVSDEVTPQIMADFYKKALATGDAAGSLSDVQRDWLVKLRDEKGLLNAVRDAGPFAMVVMANPNVKEPSDTAAMQSAGGGQTNTALGSSPEVAFASALPTPDYSVSEELPPPISSLVDAVVPPSASGTDASSPSGSAQAGSGKVLSFEEAASRADAGDAYAQAVVSIYYKVGYKVPIDLSLSAKYAMKSAAQNNPLGIYQLGSLRTQGKGMEKNPQQGLALQKKALEGIKAMPEDPYAITFSGQFNAKNNPEGAFNLYQQAAGMGYPVAVALLSNCYHYGTGTAKNPAMAAKTMKMAADMGLGLAQQAEALIESAGRN